MEKEQITFSENQRFRQPWLWLPAIAALIFPLWVLFRQLTSNPGAVDNPAGVYFSIFIALALAMGFFTLLYASRLDTRINQTGVCIRFRPFHRRWIVFPFQNMDKIQAITYRPIRDFGGWGIRYGRYGKSYTVRGNQGILLTLSGNRMILIGSNRTEEFHRQLAQSLR